MSRRSPRPCGEPGCPTLVYEGPRCSIHESQHERARGTSTQRGYDVRHREWRDQILKRDPQCKATGCAARSTVADHIVPIRQGGARFDLRNGQGMCETCHNRKRQLESMDARRKP